MNLQDLEADLPNGLHDTRILSFVHLEDERRAEFLTEVWIGDLQSNVHSLRERHAPARIELLEVAYFTVDEPHPKVLVRGSKAITIGACTAEPSQEDARRIPEGSFAGRFYIFEWNAFIHFIAHNIRFTWLQRK